MDDKVLVKLMFTNGSLVKSMDVYESGSVKENGIEVKKISVVKDIKEYLDLVKEQGFDKSAFDDKCQIEYEGNVFNSGGVYSNIELMIRNNSSLSSINKNNQNIRNKQNEKKNELNNKLKIIEENKSKVEEIYNNRLQLNIDNLTNTDLKEFVAIRFDLDERDSFKLGESRVLSKYIDISNDVDYPSELVFLAQINLEDISKYDKNNILPKNGHLYFFQGPVIDNVYYECGKVIYSEDNNLVRKNVFIYDDDMILELGIGDITIKKESYSDENERENKIFGIYSDPQLIEDDILKVSNNYIVLLQLGWDIYGEGVITFLITKEDLINKDFSKVIYTYSQT